MQRSETKVARITVENAATAVERNGSAVGRGSDSASAHQEPDDQHDQQNSANPAADHRTAVIVAASTAKK